MNIITANELTTNGIASLDAGLKDDSEALITVEGKNRFVVMNFEYYQQLQDLQLIASWQETRQDITNGDFHTGIDRHIEKIKQAIAPILGNDLARDLLRAAFRDCTHRWPPFQLVLRRP